MRTLSSAEIKLIKHIAYLEGRRDQLKDDFLELFGEEIQDETDNKK